MAYSVGGKIEATDYNGFVSTGATNLNAIWNVGSGNRGYGQTALGTVNVGDTVYAVLGLTKEWNKLIQTIIAAAAHQGTALGAWVDSNPTAGETIYYEANMGSNLTAIDTNRLNAAAQGATSSTTITNGTTWNDSLTFTWNINFGADNNARYFFNAGGQISIACAHPNPAGTTIDDLIADICSDAGTTWLSSQSSVVLAGTTYTGVTKVGGANPGGSTVNTGNGFYALGAAAVTLAEQKSDFAYHTYNNSFLRYSASYNGAGLIVITAAIDEVNTVAPVYGGLVVSTGTTSTLTIRPPSTANLTDTWGAPTITSSITPVSQP